MGCLNSKESGAKDRAKLKKELHSIFQEFDEDGDGCITQPELSRALKRIGLQPSSLEVNAMFTAADRNKDGKIRFEEFESLMKNSPALRSLQATFSQFDVDGDGKITEDELSKVVQQLGLNISAEEVRTMFKTADTSGDGRISFEEFAQLMKKHPLVVSLREVFQQFDLDEDGFISEPELRVVCRKLSIAAVDSEVNIMFKAADKNNDGKISFDEFSELLTQRQ